MKIPLCAWLLACAAAPAMAQSNVLLDAPVRITAATRGGHASDSASASTSLDLVIRHGSHEFHLTVAQRGNAAEALATQRLRTGWKDGYLFVRDDCLGANAGDRAWRCVVDQVFTFVDSREGKRLVHLGEVAAGDDCIEEARFGCALYQKTFTDIYDALETNPLTGRAEAPALLLEIQETNGQLVVDLDETWGRNQERFTAGERCLAASAADRDSRCTEGITPRRAYLFNTALATYTRRTDHLMRIRAFARAALCEGSAETNCSDTLRVAALMMAGIRPGERPRPRQNVKAVLLPAEK
ncbi:MAG: hypothetical protein ABI790_15165 [Betaproteobacteria bacterium]